MENLNLEQRVAELEQQLAEMRSLYYSTHFSTHQVIDKDLYIRGNTRFENGKTGFFNVTPVAQQSAVTTPSGGGSSSTDAIDITARTAIGQIKTALQNLGLTS